MPTSITPIMSSEVATGRRMNKRDGPPLDIGFLTLPPGIGNLCRFLRPATAATTATASATRLNIAAGVELVLAVCDYGFAGVQSLGDSAEVSFTERDGHVAHFRCFVGLYGEDVSALRPALNRRRRHYRVVLTDLQQQARIHEL